MDMTRRGEQPDDGERYGSRIAPKREAGWARRVVSAALAAALSWPVGAVAADRDPSLGASCDSTTGCLTTALTGLVSGFTSTAGGQLWGWIMGGSQSAGVSAITSDLNTIVGQLNAIENDLTAIEQQLQQLQCSFDANFVDTYAGPIQSYYDTYQDWLVSMQNGNAPPSIADVSEWANCVVGFPVDGQTCQDDKILTYMTTLNDLATAGAGSGGSISDCIKAKGSAPAENTLDDRPYYATAVQPITDWYLGVNTQAMVVLTEAYHFRAWQAAGSPSSSSADDLYANVCGTGTGLPPDGCSEPPTIYGQQFVPFMQQQLEAGGAPYSTDTHLLVNGAGQLLVRSIETYNAAAGVACPDPQVDPTCGPAAGKPSTFSMQSYAVSPYGYGGGGGAGTWQIADQSLFESLLDQGFNQTPTQVDGTVTPGEFLCTMSMTGATPNPSSCTQTNGGEGLQNADKLVQFKLTYNYEVNTVSIGQLQCFLDGFMPRSTAPQPFCSASTFDQVLEPIISGPGCPALNWAQTAPNVVNHMPYYPNWYEAFYCYSPDGAADSWRTSPGYLSNPVPQDYASFWWPSLALTSISCDNGKSALDASNANPAGVPALCRQADFQIWFDAIVPPGPTQVSAGADTALDAAAPNTNDGADRELRLAGQGNGTTKVALLGFDPAKLQAFLKAGPLDNARLVLTSSDTSTGGVGHWLVLRPLRAEFVEGNGNVAMNDRGSGSGATWNCAEDADISDDAANCLQDWPQPMIGWRGASVSQKDGSGAPVSGDVSADTTGNVSADTTAKVSASGDVPQAVQAQNRGRGHEWHGGGRLFQPDGYSGPVSWDVTEDVRHGIHAWVLGRVFGSGSLAYVSREGAAAEGDPSLAPTLILSHPAGTAVSQKTAKPSSDGGGQG